MSSSGTVQLKRLLRTIPEGALAGSIMSRRRVTWQTRLLILNRHATRRRCAAAAKSAGVLQSIYMVDFNKQLSGGVAGAKPIVPTEIYEKADRESDTGQIGRAHV